jgi:hypothetical protein
MTGSPPQVLLEQPFCKSGVWCFHESLVLNPNFVLLMKFSAKKPALRQAENRWLQA